MLQVKRDILAILYSALIFGTILTPYGYIAGGALSYFRPAAILIVLPWLVTCTALLLLIFVSETTLEERLASKFARSWPAIMRVVVVAAMWSTYFIVSRLANFTLLNPVEYWYYLIVTAGAVTAVALVFIIVARPSRLERALAPVFRAGTGRRAVGILGLLVVLIVAASKLHEYYLYKRPPV